MSQATTERRVTSAPDGTTPPVRSSLLDALDVPQGWEQPVSAGLLLLEQESASDRPVFPSLFIRIASERETLLSAKGNFKPKDAFRTPDIYADRKIAVLVNQLAGKRQPPTLALRLTTIAVAFRLEGDPLAGKVAEFAVGVLRQKHPSSKALTAGLPSVKSVADLVVRYDTLARQVREKKLETKKPEAGASEDSQADIAGADFPHADFERVWQHGLRSRLEYAVRSASLSRQSSISEGANWVTPSGDQYSVDPPTSDGNPESDDGSLGTEQYPAHSADERPPSEDASRGRARAGILSQRRSAQICRAPDHVIPGPLLANTIREVAARADQAIANGQVEEAERMIALQLVAATGCRAIELGTMVRAKAPGEAICAVDLDRGWFLRPETRPPQAFTPAEDDKRPWLATGGAVVFALPHLLLAQLSALLSVSGGGPEGRLFRTLAGPSAATVVDQNKKPAIRVATWLDAIAPGLAIGANELRTRFAAWIAGELGPEAAQIALGDSLGIPLSATYYFRCPASAITDVVWRYTATLFGDAGQPAHVPTHDVGSRTAIPSDVLKQRVESFVSNTTATPKGDAGLLDRWRNYMDAAVGALLHATGARPNKFVEDLHLYDFCPEYGLVAFCDKRVDPAHQVRIAATGTLALEYIRRYVRLLVDIRSRQSSHSRIATEILRNELPLFTIPASSGSLPVDRQDLFNRLLGEFSNRAYLLRHRANQSLIAQKVDPEIRHQQLGWFITPATALSDLSPLSGMEFAERLSPALDAYMGAEGWGSLHAGRGAFWDGVPMPPLRDWRIAETKHASDHEDASRSLRANIKQKREAILREARPRLQEAFEVHAPTVRLDSKHWTLQSVDSAGPRIEIPQDVVLAVFDHAVEDVEDQVASIVIRAELARILRHGNTRGVTHAYIPSYQRFNFGSVPSPFLREFGCAVRQAEALREFVRTSATWEEDTGTTSVACRILLGIVLLTPYRTFDLAFQILKHLQQATRGGTQKNFLRIPVDGDQHLVVGGEASLLLRNWTTAQTCPSRTSVANWFRAHLDQGLLGRSATTGNILDRIEGTARAAARVELSGPERLHLMGEFSLNVVSAERAMGRHEAWTPNSVVDSTGGAVDNTMRETRQGRKKRVPGSSRARVESVMHMLNTKLRVTLPLTQRVMPPRGRGRKAAVRHELDLMLIDAQVFTVGRAVTEYARHLLGGPIGDGSKSPEAISVHTYLTRFAKLLSEILDDIDLEDCAPEDIAHAYTAILLSKSTAGGSKKQANYRREVFDALRRFHLWLYEAHGLDDIEWADLASIAGERNDGVDPGLLWPEEVTRVLEQLHADTESFRSRPDCSPADLRQCEQRELFAALHAATDCRPSSIFGLTFSDLVFSKTDDWIHIRRTGNYGNAKTKTSIGFHRLTGDAWRGGRTRWVEWVERERARLGEASDALPVFGLSHEPHEQPPRTRLTDRINQLIAWSTGDSGGHLYWFRKTFVIAEHEAVWESGRPTALQVQRVLSECGHAHILIPLPSYLHDPDAIFAHYLHGSVGLTAKRVIGLTGLKRVTIESGWQRQRNGHSVATMSDADRLAITLGSCGFEVAAPPDGQMSPSPQLTSPKRTLCPADIGNFIAEAQRIGDHRLAAARAGLTTDQYERVVEAAGRWAEHTGWRLLGASANRQIRKPREFHEAKHMLAALDGTDPTSTALALEVAGDWYRVLRLAGAVEGLLLHDSEERDRAVSLLQTLEVSYTIDDKRDPPVLKPIRSRGNSSSGRQLSLWQALTWFLAVTWVSHRTNINTG